MAVLAPSSRYGSSSACSSVSTPASPTALEHPCLGVEVNTLRQLGGEKLGHTLPEVAVGLMARGSDGARWRHNLGPLLPVFTVNPGPTSAGDGGPRGRFGREPKVCPAPGPRETLISQEDEYRARTAARPRALAGPKCTPQRRPPHRRTGTSASSQRVRRLCFLAPNQLGPPVTYDIAAIARSTIARPSGPVPQTMDGRLREGVRDGLPRLQPTWMALNWPLLARSSRTLRVGANVVVRTTQPHEVRLAMVVLSSGPRQDPQRHVDAAGATRRGSRRARCSR